MPEQSQTTSGNSQLPGESHMAGILLFMLAWTIVPMMDGAAKYLGGLGYPVMMIVWARFFLGFVMAGVVATVQDGAGAIIPRRGARLLHLIRAVMLLLATMGFFTAIQTMPMATALAIYFVFPFIVTALSPWLLGESVGWHRWAAVVVGFSGTVIIVRPEGGMIDPGILWVLGGATAFAFYNILTRKLTGSGSAFGVLAWQGLVGAVVLLPVIFWMWKIPENLTHIGLFLLIGAVSVAGHFCVILAYARAPAPVLAPFSYFEIVSTTTIGFIVFNEFPDMPTLAGIAIIISSGVYISIREKLVRRKKGASG